jgi:hypothetical protein
MTMMTIKRAASVRRAFFWLPLGCVMLAFFSFASMACAAQCSGTNCAQMSGDTAPKDDNGNQGLDIMIGGGCALCCNILVDLPALSGEQPPSPLLFSAVLAQQSSRRIAPDTPLPRIIAIL